MAVYSFNQAVYYALLLTTSHHENSGHPPRPKPERRHLCLRSLATLRQQKVIRLREINREVIPHLVNYLS